MKTDPLRDDGPSAPFLPPPTRHGPLRARRRLLRWSFRNDNNYYNSNYYYIVIIVLSCLPFFRTGFRANARAHAAALILHLPRLPPRPFRRRWFARTSPPPRRISCCPNFSAADDGRGDITSIFRPLYASAIRFSRDDDDDAESMSTHAHTS